MNNLGWGLYSKKKLAQVFGFLTKFLLPFEQLFLVFEKFSSSEIVGTNIF